MQWESIGPFGNSAVLGCLNGGVSGNGQIHRIVFDPNYNGTNNQTIYAGSFYGGLWKSTDRGQNWAVLNTDDQLPIASVSGIAISHSNTSNLFISTGGGHEENFDWEKLYTGQKNPVLTTGIYRSMDGGANWEAMNEMTSGGVLLDQFPDGGAFRELHIDPNNEDNLIGASSNGLYISNNATQAMPTWKRVNIGFANMSEDFSDIEFHPDPVNNSGTFYTASDDIFKTDDGGLTWTKLTGAGTSLDFSTLNSNSFNVSRIKLAVTEASGATDRLYAYVKGRSNTNVPIAFFFVYINNNWQQISGSIDAEHALAWMGFDVSPIDGNQIAIGSLSFYMDWDINTVGFTTTTSCALGAIDQPHDDIHEIVYEPASVGNDPSIFFGHHGGISRGDINSSQLKVDNYALNNGMNTSLIWSFDVSKINTDKIYIGRQDNGSHDMQGLINSNFWTWLGDGDGFGVQILNEATKDYLALESIIRSNNDFSGNLKNPDPSYPLFTTIVPKARLLPMNAWLKAYYGLNKPQTTQGHNKRVAMHYNFPAHDHPTQNKSILGFSELFSDFDIYNYLNKNTTDFIDRWEIQSDQYASHNPPGQYLDQTGFRGIVDFEVAKSDINYVYITSSGSPGGSRFFVSKTGLSDNSYIDMNPKVNTEKFLDESMQLPTISYAGSTYRVKVTGLTVSTMDPNTVFISTSGYKDGYKVFKSTNAGDSWTAIDNGCLPNLPANDIVYQDGSNNRVYVAMDNGVYYTDDDLNGQWYSLEGIPNCRVNSMKISYCENKLYASTWGRGLWSTDLLPAGDLHATYEIDQNTIWDDDRTFDLNLKVLSGNSLTIKGTVYMPQKGRIFVEKGASLILDGGTITNSCDNFWGGIELWGDNAQNQFPLNQPTHQAKLELKNGALIENAYDAVSVLKSGDWSSHGGLIQAKDATFRNCERAVAFMSYPFNNHSYFFNVKFETDANWTNLENDPPKSFVTLWDNKGTTFQGCEFVDNSGLNVYSQYDGNGIYSLDADFRVLPYCTTQTFPCPSGAWIQSSFTNLNQGIFATGSATNNSVSIDDVDFTDNMVGIRLKEIDNVSLTNNRFIYGNTTKLNFPPSSINYITGVNIEQSTSYILEQNIFEGRINPSFALNGISIDNSGEDPNQVYRNDFKNNNVGAIFLNENKSAWPFQGTQYLCNSNSVDNLQDVVISDGDLNLGIRDYQGSSGPDKPAMNTFSVSPNITNGHIENLLAPIEYYYLNGFAQGEPIYNGGTPVVRTPLSNNHSVCTLPPNPIVSGNITPQTAVADYYTLRTTYEGLLYTYFQNIDNGNTDSVLQAINLTFPSQAQQMRDDLMAQAPYVSTAALEASANSGVLTDPLLLEVCLANPDATQSEGFLDLLEYNIPNTLPSTMIQTIYQSWGNQTARTILENQLAEANSDLGRLSNQIVHYYKMDTLSHKDSLESILVSWENKNSNYQLVALAIAENDFTTADQLMTQIDTSYQLTSAEQAEHNNLVTYIDFRENISILGKSYMELDTNELNVLRNIANVQLGSGSMYARNILCFGYQECDETNNSSLNQNQKRKYDFNIYPEVVESEILNFSVLPNPANESINLVLRGTDIAQNLRFELYDLRGSLLLRHRITTFKINVPTDHLSNGSYLYRLVDDSEQNSETPKLVGEGKIIIQH